MISFNHLSSFRWRRSCSLCGSALKKVHVWGDRSLTESSLATINIPRVPMVEVTTVGIKGSSQFIVQNDIDRRAKEYHHALTQAVHMLYSGHLRPDRPNSDLDRDWAFFGRWPTAPPLHVPGSRTERD